MNRLYVGNLSYSTTDEGLREFFGEAGEVTEAEIVIDRATGRSKGFAFVTMGSDAAAQKAIEILNGQSLDNRALRIDFAKPKEDRPRSGGGGYGGGGGDRRGGGGLHAVRCELRRVWEQRAQGCRWRQRDEP